MPIEEGAGSITMNSFSSVFVLITRCFLILEVAFYTLDYNNTNNKNSYSKNCLVSMIYHSKYVILTNKQSSLRLIRRMLLPVLLRGTIPLAPFPSYSSVISTFQSSSNTNTRSSRSSTI